jgi:hypothetical protein
MPTWLRRFLPERKSARSTAPGSVRPELEALEDRLTPTITYHGGALLTHVEVQAVYLGSDWASSATYYQQTHALDAFLKNLVNSPYMDMLTAAGYGVGRGTADSGQIDPIRFDKSGMLTDAAIQRNLQTAIANGLVVSPDANRVYVVFVEDNVAVGTADGLVSRTDFLAYHGAFAGRDHTGHVADIRYVVVPYPGGAVHNASIPALSAFDNMTEVASHEIAEAATDPDVNYAALGWYDDALDDENGDIVNQEYVSLGGYVVQRIADKHDHAMTPAGAMPVRPVSFTLLANGELYEHTPTGWVAVRSGVASVSSQGIDNDGRAVVDLVLTNGDAFEYHDGGTWQFLRHGVKAAAAGQGVSFVVLNDGQLFEYHDDSARWSGALAADVVSISAGTDRFGVNLVDVVFKSGTFSEWSESTGWHALCSQAITVSAGMGGTSVVLLKDGRAYEYNEISGWTYLSNGVSQVAAGTGVGGGVLIDLITTAGVAREYSPLSGWRTLATAVASVSKARAGLVDMVFSNGGAYEHTASGWTALTSTVIAAA